MRYLGCFPFEEDLSKTILPSLLDDEEPEFVKYERFEYFMLECIVQKKYEPDNEEVLLQAFRILDTDKRGYLSEDLVVDALTSNEWGFREKEVKDFLRVTKDADNGFIHYEDYCASAAN